MTGAEGDGPEFRPEFGPDASDDNPVEGQLTPGLPADTSMNLTRETVDEQSVQRTRRAPVPEETFRQWMLIGLGVAYLAMVVGYIACIVWMSPEDFKAASALLTATMSTVAGLIGLIVAYYLRNKD